MSLISDREQTRQCFQEQPQDAACLTQDAGMLLESGVAENTAAVECAAEQSEHNGFITMQQYPVFQVTAHAPR